MPLHSQSAVAALESLIYSSWSLTQQRLAEVTRLGLTKLHYLCIVERTFNMNLDFFNADLFYAVFCLNSKVQFFGSIM